MIQPWMCQGVVLYLAWDAILLKTIGKIKHWSDTVVATRRGVYLTCHSVCNRSHFSHIAWCLQATRLNRFAVRDHSKLSNPKYVHSRKFVGESMLQQQVIHVLTFDFGIQHMRWYDPAMMWWWWFNTCHIVRNFLLELWIRSAWSVKSVLVGEPAKLLRRKKCGWR